MGWRISYLSSYNRRRDQCLDAPEAVDPLAEGVLDVIVVLQAELVGVLFEGHAHRPRGARLVGVVAAPQAIDTVQRGGRDGAVGLQADVALGAEEQQHVVGLSLGFHTVILGARVQVIVKRVADHPVSADTQPEMFRRILGVSVVLTASKIVIGISPFNISDKSLCQLNIRRKSLRPKKSGGIARNQKSPPAFLAEMQVRKGGESVLK